MTETKNFKVLAVLASVAAALAASLLVLSLFEKPAQAQASEGENTQAKTKGVATKVICHIKREG